MLLWEEFSHFRVYKFKNTTLASGLFHTSLDNYLSLVASDGINVFTDTWVPKGSKAGTRLKKAPFFSKELFSSHRGNFFGNYSKAKISKNSAIVLPKIFYIPRKEKSKSSL